MGFCGPDVCSSSYILLIQFFLLSIFTPKLLVEISQDLICCYMLALFLSEDIMIPIFSIRPFKKHSYFHISFDGYWAYLPCNQKVTPMLTFLVSLLGNDLKTFSWDRTTMLTISQGALGLSILKIASCTWQLH